MVVNFFMIFESISWNRGSRSIAISSASDVRSESSFRSLICAAAVVAVAKRHSRLRKAFRSLRSWFGIVAIAALRLLIWS